MRKRRCQYCAYPFPTYSQREQRRASCLFLRNLHCVDWKGFWGVSLISYFCQQTDLGSGQNWNQNSVYHPRTLDRLHKSKIFFSRLSASWQAMLTATSFYNVIRFDFKYLRLHVWKCSEDWNSYLAVRGSIFNRYLNELLCGCQSQ